MHGKHTGLLQPAFSPRLLVVAFSFLSTALAALLAVTCFFLALGIHKILPLIYCY